MRTSSTVIAAAALALLGACSRTESGDVVVKRPVSVDIQTRPDTIRIPGLGSTRDTTTAPVAGTKKDTIVGTTKDTIIRTKVDTTIVKKPVAGSKKTAAKASQAKKP
jgi:hypothetical protein